MYYSDRATVVKSGTPVPLSATRLMASWVELVADKDNTGLVYVGGTNTTKGTGVAKTYQGIPLYQGIWLLLRELGGQAYYDLRYVYIDADNDGDSVDFVYGRI
jgi:hypothetical protein